MKPYIVVPHKWVTISTVVLTVALVTLKVLGLLATLPWLLVFWPTMAVIIFCFVLSVANYVSVRMEVSMSMFARWLEERNV